MHIFTLLVYWPTQNIQSRKLFTACPPGISSQMPTGLLTGTLKVIAQVARIRNGNKLVMKKKQPSRADSSIRMWNSTAITRDCPYILRGWKHEIIHNNVNTIELIGTAAWCPFSPSMILTFKTSVWRCGMCPPLVFTSLSKGWGGGFPLRHCHDATAGSTVIEIKDDSLGKKWFFYHLGEEA